MPEICRAGGECSYFTESLLVRRKKMVSFGEGEETEWGQGDSGEGIRVNFCANKGQRDQEV